MRGYKSTTTVLVGGAVEIFSSSKIQITPKKYLFVLLHLKILAGFFSPQSEKPPIAHALVSSSLNIAIERSPLIDPLHSKERVLDECNGYLRDVRVSVNPSGSPLHRQIGPEYTWWLTIVHTATPRSAINHGRLPESTAERILFHTHQKAGLYVVGVGVAREEVIT